MNEYKTAVIHTARLAKICTELSSTEAEFPALSNSGRIVSWLRKILTKLREQQNSTAYTKTA